MKKKYMFPRQIVVETNEQEMLCISKDEVAPKSMKVDFSDYDTYQDTPRTPNAVNWDGVGTGSDF